jgi:hypothetical protein
VEIKLIEYVQHEPKYNPFGRYDEMTVFKYYEINSQGDIRPLDSDRIFDCTKYVKMDESYFEGCQATVDELSPSMRILQDYLTIDDLDLMRNEIFAEYGLRFKTDKWRNYFSAQPWYRPRYDDVNDKLTEIDKHNIQLILKMRAQMEKDPNRYQRTTKRVEKIIAG